MSLEPSRDQEIGDNERGVLGTPTFLSPIGGEIIVLKKMLKIATGNKKQSRK